MYTPNVRVYTPADENAYTQSSGVSDLANLTPHIIHPPLWGGLASKRFTRDVACPTKWHYFLHQVGLLRTPIMTSRPGKELVRRELAVYCVGDVGGQSSEDSWVIHCKPAPESEYRPCSAISLPSLRNSLTRAQPHYP